MSTFTQNDIIRIFTASQEQKRSDPVAIRDCRQETTIEKSF